MKIRIALIIGIVFWSFSCQKESTSDYQSSGKIIVPDLGMCICCGGWKIIIDGITYNFDSIPVNTNIDLQKITFPLYVKLDWQTSGNTGCPNWILIQRIQKE